MLSFRALLWIAAAAIAATAWTSLPMTAAPFLVAAERDEDEDDVGDLMERIHEGKRSPFARVKTQLKTPTPDWADLEKQVAGFVKMSAALKKSRKAEVRDAADGYADAVRDLAAAVTLKQLEKTRAAFKSLSDSCTDCHYKGGPGGKLED